MNAATPLLEARALAIGHAGVALGAPLALSQSPDGHQTQSEHLGPNLARHQRPFAVVPKGWWQSAVSLGRWTLMGCTVCPAFDFAGFELAPPGWRPMP